VSRAYVVTGGTGALGSAVVARLLSDGHRVAVPYRGEAGFAALAARADPARLFGRPADAADVAGIRAFVEAAVETFGALDGAALVAGGWAGSGTLEVADPAEWDAMLRTNLGSAYATCRALVPHLVGRQASVVLVGARAAAAGAGMAGYAVAKSGVAALARALALENRERGIRFNLVLPGVIDTPANRRAMPRADAARWTPPESIAEVIAFLLSPAAAAISGAEIPVDTR
jgi:NAD(P)-dependent dehydrogenase (short-subunit alcohol dehydrogenase family)